MIDGNLAMLNSQQYESEEAFNEACNAHYDRRLLCDFFLFLRDKGVINIGMSLNVTVDDFLKYKENGR